jgi:3-hydroxyacyl-CoA dehydrogenase
MSEVVEFEKRGSVGIIRVDYPPVNALSHAVRTGLARCLEQAIADDSVKSIVLSCGGRTFIAGADITEFGKGPKDPQLGTVIAAYDESPKPVVAAIFGTAL